MLKIDTSTNNRLVERHLLPGKSQELVVFPKIIPEVAIKTPIYPRILYAEDDIDAGFMLGIMLGFLGIEVVSVRTIAKALHLAQIESFDLYLLSSRFPNGSGLELCRLLREFAPLTPIVFYSGDAFPTDKAKGILAGANAYLIKPDSDTIAPTIFRLLKQSDEILLTQHIQVIEPEFIKTIEPEIKTAHNFFLV